jgi:hypothetical protein
MRPELPAARRLWVATFALLAVVVGVGIATRNTTIAGGALFLVSLGWLIVYWRVGVLVLLVLSCVDGFIKYYSGSFGTYVLKDLVLAGLIAGIARAAFNDPQLVPRGRWLGAPFVVLYVAFDAAQVLISTAGIEPAIAGFRQQALWSALFFVGVVYFDSTKRLIGTALVLVGAITFAAAVGILQYFLGPAWLNLGRGFVTASTHYVGGIGSDPGTAYRAYGTMVDPTALGLASGVGIVLAVGLAFTDRSWLQRFLLIGAAGICTLALYYSATRSAIAGTVAGLLAVFASLAVRRDARRYVAGVLAVAVAVSIIAIPFTLDLVGTDSQTRFSAESESYAIATRQRGVDRVLDTVGQKPFGFGLGVTGAGGRNRLLDLGAFENYLFSVDNVYLTALYETGPIGLLLLIAVQGGLLFLTLRGAFAAKGRQLGIAYAVIAGGQVSLLVSGWFNQGSFVYAPMAQAFWLFAGAVALPKRIEAGDSSDAVEPRPRTVPLRTALRPIGDPRRIQLVTRMRSPGAAAVAVKPLTEADIERAIARFDVRLRARLLELAEAGHWSQYSADELFGRAGRELFVDLKKALAALETDPFSREGASAVIGSSVEVAALMLMLADKFSNGLSDGAP